jgi:hypothetical protein
MKVLISGASGFVGTALTAALRVEGHTVARLVRPGGTASEGDIPWNPAAAIIDTAAMQGVDAVVNLNGASIAALRWTRRRKQTLRASRIGPTRILVDSISQLHAKPRVFVSASATGYYGNRGDKVLTESNGPGAGFLSTLARDWEAEANCAELNGSRTVILRFGVILSAKSGALPKMLTPFRLGLGGRLGDGSQWLSWIALEDAVGAVLFAITNDHFKGPLNVVAPNPVRNSEFTRTLASIMHRPAAIPVPAFVLRLMLGQLADELLLASQRVRPERLLAEGYAFRHDKLESALRAILRKT